MQKISIFIISLPFFLLSPFVFASGDGSTEGDGKVGSHGNNHPPHSHDHHDHLKHIRGHGTDRKKKSPRN